MYSFTGKAAFNIKVSTLVPAFNILISQTQKYVTLPQHQVHTVCAKLSSVKIFVIDYISMTDNRQSNYKNLWSHENNCRQSARQINLLTELHNPDSDTILTFNGWKRN